jgi:hypothetical protein
MPAKKPPRPNLLSVEKVAAHLVSRSPEVAALTGIGLKKFKLTLRADNPRRKTKFVLVRGQFLGIEYQFKVPRGDLQDVLDRISDREASDTISPGDDLMFRLRDMLQRELTRSTEKKPKGSQAKPGLAYFVQDMKWVAPWVYCFLSEVCQKGGLDHPLIASAEAELAKEKTIASKLSPRKRAIYLTAILISKAYPDWHRLGLRHPISDPDDPDPKDFEPEIFYRTYISPHLKEILAEIEKKPRLLIPRYNSFLRPVFTVYGF